MPIEQITLPAGTPVEDLWREAAQQTRAWLARQGLAARDAVVLLPFAALLPPARAAWAEQGGWQPRIETPLTLAGALGPPEPPLADGCSGDATLDPLSATLMLRGLSWGAEWAERDPAGFARLVGELVQAAQALRSAAHCVPPPAREAHWAQLRDQLPTATGPASTEALLLRVALEWAAAGGPSMTDRLYALRPSAWIVVRLGGPEPQSEALLGHDGIPSLRIVSDPSVAAPYDEVSPSAALHRVLCDDFEAEAQAATAAVIDALNAGRHPVALVALDREVVRRVRALLVRAQVPVVDETGWLLATTRVASALMAQLKAATPSASLDDQLDWLKTWPQAAPRALNALEARWRGRPPGSPQDQAAADALAAAATTALAPLTSPQRRSLSAWLTALWGCLESGGQLERWQNEPAGTQVLLALGWPQGGAWWPTAGELAMDLPGFMAWVQRTLEQQPFLPLPDPGAQVVLMPLSRAFGRPFAQVVMPGADARTLGANAPAPSLLPAAFATAAGVPGPDAQRDQQRLALAQLLRCPRVTLLRRQRDGDEPLSESPEVEWLLLTRARRQAGNAMPWTQVNGGLPSASVAAQAQTRPMPQAQDALPVTLSASRLEALRDCPYRFFARAVLRLDEAEELDAALAKREYGTWLHAVLHRFHSARDASVDDALQLQNAAEAITVEQGLDAAALLPFRASFETFVPAYLAWLQGREAQGWVWQSGETDCSLDLPCTPPLKLKGRLDRIDRGPGGELELLDYKTGSTQSLKDRVKDPLEDTQLAFYAALMGSHSSLAAAYVSLDDAQSPQHVPHPEVATSAAALVEGVKVVWQQLADGAAMPALGTGRVCETCEARGLCRRDHWSPA